MLSHGIMLTTDLFEATTPGEHFINDRCFGEDFAAWLVERLKVRNVETSEPIQEDFGWVLLSRFGKHTFTLSIGVMDESIGQTPAEWRVDVAYEKGLNGIRSWFRSPPRDDLAALAAIVEQILRAEPRMQKVTAVDPFV